MSERLSLSTRSPEDELIFEKSVRIKQWVKKRMKEAKQPGGKRPDGSRGPAVTLPPDIAQLSVITLEDQNERLRLQNLRCTTQLQMLRSFTEKSKQLKAEMAMSRSITVRFTLFSIASIIRSNDHNISAVTSLMVQFLQR
ncbi:unnamed protein product [Angiostrongylus costaricensis]|uniref:Si:ch73-389k6.1 n=1 Tax=Angiostrongylus costaricensis TaxID=334426 RepID=A0A158PIR7_ANGCS|nr:unnamed protein product [Angiostrongylus costaricensis]